MTLTPTHTRTADLAGRFVVPSAIANLARDMQSSPMVRMAQDMQRESDSLRAALDAANQYAAFYERLAASTAAVTGAMAWVGDEYRQDTRRARRIARARREALALTRGNEADAVEVQRLLRDLLDHGREYTAGLLAAALAEPDSEAVEHVREMAAEPGDLGRIAGQVLDLIDARARLLARAERVLHLARVEHALDRLRSCPRRAPSRAPCDARKEPPAIAVRGSIERTAPPGPAACAYAPCPSRRLGGHRDATRTPRGAPT